MASVPRTTPLAQIPIVYTVAGDSVCGGVPHVGRCHTATRCARRTTHAHPATHPCYICRNTFTHAHGANGTRSRWASCSPHIPDCAVCARRPSKNKRFFGSHSSRGSIHTSTSVRFLICIHVTKCELQGGWCCIGWLVVCMSALCMHICLLQPVYMRVLPGTINICQRRSHMRTHAHRSIILIATVTHMHPMHSF